LEETVNQIPSTIYKLIIINDTGKMSKAVTVSEQGISFQSKLDFLIVED
jgi:hypothetical protein